MNSVKTTNITYSKAPAIGCCVMSASTSRSPFISWNMPIKDR